jgi:hypothetical protein
LKTRSSHEKFFLAEDFTRHVFRGQASSSRMAKGIYVPLPSKLAGFGKEDSEPSKK